MQDYTTIAGVLRLHEQQLSQRDIAAKYNIGKGTVARILEKAKKLDITYDSIKDANPDDVMEKFYSTRMASSSKPLPDFENIYKRLHERNSRCNLYYLWCEYKKEHPDGVQYTQFCAHYHHWEKEDRIKTVMVMERSPGEKMYIDWFGDTLDCVRNHQGDIVKSYFFITTLGISNYPFVEAFPDMKSNSYLKGHVDALRYYGGVPKYLVPDNCKTAVIHNNNYEFQLNCAYQELEEYYGVVILPARVYHPRDKATVENGVGWLETWLLEPLRKLIFDSFEDLNAKIMELLTKLCDLEYQKKTGTRRSLFEKIDKPYLRPLPKEDYSVCDFKLCKVPDNYHISYDSHYYSVPYNLSGQQVYVKAKWNMIVIMDKNHKVVAEHKRNYDLHKLYSTYEEHMPSTHQHQRSFEKRDGTSYRAWAKKVGKYTETVIDHIFLSQRSEEQSYRSCMAILQMGKEYGYERLEDICAKVVSMNTISYTSIKRMMKSTEKPEDLHANIRGKENYK